PARRWPRAPRARSCRRSRGRTRHDPGARIEAIAPRARLMVETLTPCTSHRFCRPTTPPAPPPWDGQLREDDYRVHHLDGAVPPGLRGALYRIGPGRFSVGARPIEHIFDGDGMVSRFQIDDDGIGFRNRFVRTETFVQSIRTGRMPRGFGTRRAGGALANALRFPQNMANTNL